MNYIVESLFVGLYTCIIYLIVVPFIKNLYILLLVVGFFKHLLGYFFKIHTWYCNNGATCLKILNTNYDYKAIPTYLIRDSMYDAIMFLIIGSILLRKINNITLFFVIGVLLHIISEHLLVHKYFCETSCIKK